MGVGGRPLRCLLFTISPLSAVDGSKLMIIDVVLLYMEDLMSELGRRNRG